MSRLINGIESQLFFPSNTKRRLISYMTRKNSKDSAIVSAFLRRASWFRESGWSLQEIKGLPQDQVASILRKSLIFLSFGHPEGFGLPLAEAGCCGCYLIGYSGLGGSELLRLAKDHRAGQEVAYGDWYGFVQACKDLDVQLNNYPSQLSKFLKYSKTIRVPIACKE